MAATAAAAIGSSFSHSIRTLKCTISHSKSCPSEHSSLRVPQTTPRAIQLAAASLTRSELLPSLLQAATVPWRRLVVSAAASVAQEPGAVEEEVSTEEQEQVEQVTGEGEVEQGGDNLPSDTKLYFGNLPYNVDSTELARIVQEYAVPELVEVIYDRESGKSKGFGFVTMSSIEDGNTVVENLDGVEFMGRPLRVNFANKPRPKVPLYPETEHKLFIGNLSWSVTAETLTEAFQKYGSVVGTRVVYDGETGKSRGYGFVCFSTKEEMDAALQGASRQELEGRQMRVSIAEGRKQQNV